MTPSLRARLLLAGALIVIAACGIAVLRHCWPIRHLVLQIYALAALFFVFRFLPPVARWLAALPGAHRAVVYLLLLAVAAGHFTLNTRRYFPFVAWDIFAAVSEQETVFCRELIGTTAGGRPVRLLVEQLFPSVVQFDLPPADEPEKIDQLVAVLARAYNARHAADPVRSVDLVLLAVKLHPPPGETPRQPSCELLHHYDLSPAPSS